MTLIVKTLHKVLLANNCDWVFCWEIQSKWHQCANMRCVVSISDRFQGSPMFNKSHEMRDFLWSKEARAYFKATGRYRQQNYSGMKFYLSIQNFGIWEFNVSFTFAFVLNCKMWNCVRCMRIWKPWFKLQINISIKTNYVLIQLLSNVEKKMFHV